MSLVDVVLKNEYSKRALRVSRLRVSPVRQRATEHYRMPVLARAGGCLVLSDYGGSVIASSEWESLVYTTYANDPTTFFAPITSATGEIELSGFWHHGKPDLGGLWTENAARCPTIVSWVESIGARFGRVQLLRMDPNTIRESRWGLHLDNNNELNPPSNGWIVRLWLELTDDPRSALVIRPREFDRRSEQAIPLPRGKQVLLDSEAVFHSGYHAGPDVRYALIVSLESGAALESFIRGHRSAHGAWA